jgi:2-dehydro-3-deoxy-D-arabinonate dehydratase
MALCRYRENSRADGAEAWGWLEGGRVWRLDPAAVTRVLLGADSHALESLSDGKQGEPLDGTVLTAPVVTGMEIWAAGVTYESSKFARMAESTDGGDFYAKVYVADRPELFFKATPSRTVGPNGAVRVRADSKWNVPEPELAVVASAAGRILGYTVGNDMSSRDIEGENPLYLPQAKVYRGSCALGPAIIPASHLDPANLPITLTITRSGETAYCGETSTARMRRTVEELVDWLFRENDFPYGVVLLTGTGLIPPDDFSLAPGDDVAIEIGGIGVLHNSVSA